MTRAGTPATLPTLVFVGRRRCGASRKMESLVAWVEVTQKRRVRVLKLDADEHGEVARRLRVRSVPSLVLVHAGQVLGRLEGRSTGRQIDELIAAHLAD